jgi:SAM-dependent methyltransferase
MNSHDRYTNRIDFYRGIIATWISDRTDSILVVGGGMNDEQVFRSLGFQHVTLTNVDSAVNRGSERVAAIASADAESLPYASESFDYVVVHAVLHHCRSPHRALLEMYRVARKAAIFFESRDSFSIRLAQRLGFANPYELTAVAANNGLAGGVCDTAVPNYVYRWTEREVRKTIASYAPHATHTIDFAHGYGTPCQADRNGPRGLMRAACIRLYRVFVAMFPSQRNLLACRVQKPTLPRDLQPWLAADGDAFRFSSS